MYVCVNSISLYLILKQKCFRSHLSLVVNLQTPIKLKETEKLKPTTTTKQNEKNKCNVIL